MAAIDNPYDYYTGPSSVESPGGFVFGPQGWSWGQPRAKTITFFLDGTAKVSDQFGRPIKGTVGADNKPILFAQGPPLIDGLPTDRAHFATHKQVIEALKAENVDWKTLTCAGFPQLPYEELRTLAALPPTPVKELRKIRDPELRKAALKARTEADEKRQKELHPEDEE